MSATERLRALLDERGVEYDVDDTQVDGNGTMYRVTYAKEGYGRTWVYEEPPDCDLLVSYNHDLGADDAVAATLGREPRVDPTWERWHKSLRHDEIKSIGDAVEQLMYEAIEFGGDMGPNGNTYNGIDEGDVLTSGFINDWIARFESTLGRDRYTYEQYREISNAVGDAMEYAHDRAIEHPDKADPFWNLDEYVSRILKVAFEGEATLGRRTCHVMTISEFNGEYTDYYDVCSNCGYEFFDDDPLNYCPSCGRRIETDE